MSIVLSIFILGFIIFIHEFGHFTFAKLFKVPVREFSIGMGPRLFSFVKNNTRYSLKALPFGGSCAMVGEDAAGSGDFDDGIGVVNKENNTINYDGVVYDLDYIEKYNFSKTPPLKKMIICVSGPLFNFLLALILSFVMIVSFGYDEPRVVEVAESSAASEATPFAIQTGDIITNLKTVGDDSKISFYRQISLFMELNRDEFVENHSPILVTLDRDSDDGIKKVSTVLYPKYDEETKRPLMGLSFNTARVKTKNLLDNFKYAFNEFYFYIDMTIKSLRLLIRGKVGVNEISGPVGTVAIMGDAIETTSKIDIQSTIYTILMLVVLISSNLGFMNLLPIPALDGGRIVFSLIEIIIGRPLNKKFEAIANGITMSLLLLFMVYIFGMDIMKIFRGM